jgi:hypothetical protein
MIKSPLIRSGSHHPIHTKGHEAAIALFAIGLHDKPITPTTGESKRSRSLSVTGDRFSLMPKPVRFISRSGVINQIGLIAIDRSEFGMNHAGDESKMLLEVVLEAETSSEIEY